MSNVDVKTNQQEYVTMNNGCYIELPFIADNNTKVVCDVVPLSKNNTDAYFFGSGIMSSSPDRFGLKYYNNTSTDQKPHLFAGTFSGRRDSSIFNLRFNNDNTVEMSATNLKINGNNFNFNGGTFTALKNFIINGCYTANTTISAKLSAKWKSIQIFNGTTLVYDLVAWKDDNDIYGLYDKLSKTLFTSSSDTPILVGG